MIRDKVNLFFVVIFYYLRFQKQQIKRHTLYGIIFLLESKAGSPHSKFFEYVFIWIATVIYERTNVGITCSIIT